MVEKAPIYRFATTPDGEMVRLYNSFAERIADIAPGVGGVSLEFINREYGLDADNR